MSQRTIEVEMYIGWGDHTWGTRFVNVPASTPDHLIPTEAQHALIADLEREDREPDYPPVAFIGVYHYSPDETDEDEFYASET